MTSVTRISGSKSSTAYREPEEPRAGNGRSALLTPEKTAEGIAHTGVSVVREVSRAARVGARQDTFLAVLAGQLVAFYDWLSGPPTTERDRLNGKLAESERIRRAVEDGVYHMV